VNSQGDGRIERANEAAMILSSLEEGPPEYTPDLDEAERLLANQVRLLGADHPDLLAARNNLVH